MEEDRLPRETGEGAGPWMGSRVDRGDDGDKGGEVYATGASALEAGGRGDEEEEDPEVDGVFW